MKPKSIRFKATILYTSVLFGILAIYSGVLFGITRHILFSNLDEELRIKASEIVNILKSYEKLRRLETPHRHLLNKLLGLPDHTRLIMDDLWRSDMQALNLEDDYIAIVNALGQPVIRSKNFNDVITEVFEKQFPLSLTHGVFQNLRNGNLRLRAVNFPFLYGNRQLLVIRIGTPMNELDRTLDLLLYFIGAGIVSILLITSFMGRVFARRILQPVVKATEIVEDISHTDLHLRIPAMEADAEMRRLITAFNAMIERLETSFTHVNEFSSHVAHELKTPLAIVRGEVELALHEPRDVSEYQRVLTVSLEEIDRLIRIIKDLLMLARLDYNPEVFRFEKINLKEFLAEIHEYTGILCAEKGVTSGLMVPEADCFVRADRVHLRRLFLNLIHNAVKFTPSGGDIRIVMAIEGNEVRITVSDTGSGIAPPDLEKIFEKFFRAHDSSIEAGSGLGLSIALSIARAHKGRITVHSTPGQGSVFTVHLPAAA